MLYDRIVDNKEIGRTIWKICTAFINHLYSVERFALHCMICTALNDMYYVEWFVLSWVICTTLNDLNNVAWSVQRWIICSIALNYLYCVEWSVLHLMICTTLNDFFASLQNLCDLKWFVQLSKIYTTLNNSECNGCGLHKCQVCLFEKIL